MDNGDPIEMSLRASADQGMFETEVSIGGKSDLPRLKLQCDKNPDHMTFICRERLSLDDFPDEYRDKDILELTNLQADLTVCMCVKCTSVSRPATFPGSTEPYPFYTMRGNSGLRIGTGSIILIHDYDKSNTNVKCICKECRESNDPKEEWGKVIIETVNHIVFNDEETEETEIELFYDNENREQVCKLQGKIMLSDVKSDWCLIYCPTHDTQLVRKLQEIQHRFEILRKEVYEKYKDRKPNLVVIVSHPHGLCKHFTIGKYTDREELNDFPFSRYTYTADTCRGSSGARVLVLAEHSECRWACPLHRERLPCGRNRSSVGWY